MLTTKSNMTDNEGRSLARTIRSIVAPGPGRGI